MASLCFVGGPIGSAAVLVGGVIGVGIILAGNGVAVPDALRAHYVTFLLLLPFVVMFAVHRTLGFSDALVAAPAPSEREAQLYNLVMALAAWGGSAAYVVHAGTVARRSTGWVALKLLFLAGFWLGLFLFLR